MATWLVFSHPPTTLPSMLRWAAAFLLLATMPMRICGQEPPEKETEKAPFTLKSYHLLPGFFQNLETRPVVFRSHQDPSANHYDVREDLEKFGIPFPPGAAAVFRPARSLMLLRNTPENHEMWDSCVTMCGFVFPGDIVCEIRTFECDLPRKDFASTPSYADLERLPPGAIKLLDQERIISRAAVTAETRRTIPVKPLPPGKLLTRDIREQLEDSQRFADDETGTIATLCPQFGPDGTTLNTDIAYRFKMATAGGASQEFQFSSSFDSATERPIVIYSAPIPDSDGKTLVVVAKTQLISNDGTKLSFKPLPTAGLSSSP